MNIIKRIIQNVFRYRLTACFFIIGQLIMYVTIFGALGIYNKAYQKEADRLAALYKNRIEMSVVSLNKSDILSACTDGVTEGNIRAKKVGLYYTERKSSTLHHIWQFFVHCQYNLRCNSGRFSFRII